MIGAGDDPSKKGWVAWPHNPIFPRVYLGLDHPNGNDGINRLPIPLFIGMEGLWSRIGLEAIRRGMDGPLGKTVKDPHWREWKVVTFMRLPDLKHF